jgi:hypothetical protein
MEFVAQPRPVDESRTANVDQDTPVLLRNIHHEVDGDFLWDLTRIRNIPALPVSDLAGNEDRITFTGRQRPAEYTAGIFDVATRILALHDLPHGVTHTMVAKYWQLIIPELGRFRFDPILEQRAADLVMTAGGFARFSTSLAHMGNEQRLRGLGLTDDHILDLIRTYSSPNIVITLSIDPRAENAGTLSVNRIRDLANALLGLGRKHVKKLSLVVEDEAGDRFPVNLLKDRIMESEDLTPEEAAEVTDEIRYRAIRNAWGSRKNELRARYRDVE